MIIELLPNCPNRMNDMQYVHTYCKGKKKSPSIADLRLLVKDVVTSEEKLLYLWQRNFGPGNIMCEISTIEITSRPSADLLKGENGRYNYWKLRHDPADVAAMLQTWSDSDPFVSVLGGTHYSPAINVKSGTQGYAGSFRYNGVVY